MTLYRPGQKVVLLAESPRLGHDPQAGPLQAGMIFTVLSVETDGVTLAEYETARRNNGSRRWGYGRNGEYCFHPSDIAPFPE